MLTTHSEGAAALGPEKQEGGGPRGVGGRGTPTCTSGIPNGGRGRGDDK